MALPVNSQQGPQLLGNLVQVQPVARPAVVNHYNIQPVIDVYASTQDRDLGGVAAATDQIIKRHSMATCRAAPNRASRPGEHHAFVVRRAGRRTAGRDRAGLSADRDQFSVVARSLHHHLCTAGSAGGNLLVPAADPHDSERAVADGRGDVHGRGDRELDSDGQLCARADGRGQ